MDTKYTKNFKYILGFLLFFVFALSFNKFNTQPVFANSTTDVSTAKDTQLEIKLNVKSKTLVKEKSYGLRVYNITEKQKVTYKSSDTEIATVDETGNVTGIAIGTATITVTVKDGLKTVATLSCDITVGPPAISVKFTKNDLILVVGKRSTLKTILQPYNTAEDIKFSTYDSTIASVSPGGRVTANALGTTHILAMIDNGKYDLCKVLVVDEETYLKLLESSADSSATEHNAITPSITVTPTS